MLNKSKHESWRNWKNWMMSDKTHASAYQFAKNDHQHPVVALVDPNTNEITTHPRKLDEIMLCNGFQKHDAKDVNASSSCMCVGVELVDGSTWCAPANRAWAIILAVGSLFVRRYASPGALRALLGSMQWLDLLERGKRSIYRDVYCFCRKTPEWTQTYVPNAVISEFLCGAILGPFWSFDMQKLFHPEVLATDASCEYGYGACVASLGGPGVRALSKLDAKVGDHAILESGRAPDDEHQYWGPAHVIPLSRNDFRVVLQLRVRSDDHINVREGKAFLTTVRWLLRSSQRHGRRFVVLVDSRVWLGAVVKGRSSSVPLNSVLRQLAALVMASGVILHLVYVSSKWNPADDPSRGRPLRAGKSSQKCKPSNQTCSIKNASARRAASVQRLIDSGMLSPSTSNSDSDESVSSMDQQFAGARPLRAPSPASFPDDCSDLGL